jgi:hypothetical protein
MCVSVLVMSSPILSAQKLEEVRLTHFVGAAGARSASLRGG